MISKKYIFNIPSTLHKDSTPVTPHY